jgi:hypothetical protein
MAKAVNSKILAPLLFLLGAIAGYLGHSFFGPRTTAPSAASTSITVTNYVTAATPPPEKITAAKGATLDRIRNLLSNRDHPDLAAVLLEIPNLTLAECPQALELFRGARGVDENVLVPALGRRWAALDPIQAMEHASKLDDRSSRGALLYIAAEVLAARNPDAVFNFVSNSKNVVTKLMNAHAVLPVLAKIDPARVTKYLADHPQFRSFEDIYEQVGAAYAAKSPIEALNWAAALPSYKLREEAGKSAWVAWASADPAKAAAALRNPSTPLLPTKTWSQDVYRTLGSSFSAKDPQAARDWIESLPDQRDQNQAWAFFKPPLDQLGPDAALELVNSISSPDGKSNLADRIVAELAKKDLTRAIAWTDRLTGETRERAIGSLINEWSQTDPAAAVGYASALPQSKSRTDLLRRSVPAWSIHDPEAALAWTRTLQSEDRNKIATETARALRVFDPQRAVAWLDLIENPTSRDHTMQEIVGALAGVDGPGAVALATTLSEGRQTDAFSSIARSWAFNDYQATGNWIQTLQPGRARDAAIEAYVSVIDGLDIQAATQWATTIETPELRDRATSSAFRRWMQEKPETAQAWLDTADLSDNLRQQLTSFTETRREN